MTDEVTLEVPAEPTDVEKLKKLVESIGVNAIDSTKLAELNALVEKL